MSASFAPGAPETFTSKAAFETVLEHWAKARIDGPMQVVARFDEAAKQLITLGGLFQGLFFTVVTFGGVKDRVPLWLLAVFFVPLVALVICAAKVICTVPTKMEAIDTYTLLRRAASPEGLADEDLTQAVRRWCVSIDSVAARKHRWLVVANVLFWVSSAFTLVLLLYLVRM